MLSVALLVPGIIFVSMNRIRDLPRNVFAGLVFVKNGFLGFCRGCNISVATFFGFEKPDDPD